MMNFNKHQSTIYCVLLGIIIGALFIFGAPMDGSFSWADSPRHALNGAFIMDLFKDLPFDDPVGYAYNYYSQFPALTILFYPPLYSFILAPFYAIFGVSQESALLTGYVCYTFSAVGVYFLARNWLSQFASFSTALIFVLAPEITFWGRQVMLEVPVYAFLIWGIYFFVEYIKTEKIYQLYLSIALLVLGLYIKTPIAFIAIPLLFVLFRKRGLDVFKDKHTYIIAFLAIVGIIPLVYITLEFGQVNLQAVTDIADAEVDKYSLSGLLWYLLQTPSQLGIGAFIGVLTGIVTFFIFEENKSKSLKNAAIMVLWYLVGYIFYTMIDLKEARFNVHMLLPLFFLIGLAYDHIEAKRQHIGKLFITLVAASTLYSTLNRPVEYVSGYNQVALKIAELAPENSNVMFSGYRDGSFIFAMRAVADRDDMSTIRSDKLLLQIASRREIGVEEKDYTSAEIATMINELAINYVVAQPDFWTDLEQMALLQSLLESDQFQEVKRYQLPRNYPSQEKELVIYKNLGPVAQGPVRIENELSIIGRTVTSEDPN